MSGGALTAGELAVLEALVDPRTGVTAEAVDADLRAQLARLGLDDPEAARAAVTEAACARPIEWGSHRLTQGELLAVFARHCETELDDVTIEEATPTTLTARWRSELSRIELRAGAVRVERLASETPTMLVADVAGDTAGLVNKFLDVAELRARVAVFDPVRLEKIGAVRSSVFVYLEWHLRDEYGVKVVPSPEFTRGLVDRGIISLGMG
jgi:hypothetical protein